MKIPYIKLYTADLLAASRHLTGGQLGDAVRGLCEIAFENETDYVPQTAREKAFFDLLLQWKEESKTAWKQNKRLAQKAAQARWKKQALSGGASSISRVNATVACQTETDTETETKPYTETETENISLILPLNEGEKERELFSKRGY